MINTIEEAIGRLRYIQLDSEHSPEEILHMVLAGGSTQTLYNVSRGFHQSAIEFLCRETGQLPGYPLPGGVIKEDENGRPYFTKGLERFRGNERTNEFLGALAVAGIHFDATAIVTDRGTEATLVDLTETAMQNYVESNEESAWSLMLFSVHPGVTKEWKNKQGEIQSVDRILRAACARPYGFGSCFGTHNLAGIAFAVARYCLEQDMEPSRLEGVWLRGFEYVSGAIRLMRRNQKEDSSIDRCWFRQKSYPQTKLEWSEKLTDIASRRFRPAKAIVYPTGHCLDAISSLSMFLGPERDWIYSACYIMAQTIETQWTQLVPEICTLSHAVHALKVLGE